MKADKGGVSLDHDTKEKVTKWTEPNGNKCFHFSERQLFEHTWIIILVALLLIAVTGSEYLLNSSFYTLTPNFILFFFAFLWWMTIPLRANEAVIEETVHELMDGMVAADANAIGTEVAKSFVHYDIKGTYAIITGRFFLVLLKNGEVWEYLISYHEPTNEKNGYYECEKSHEVSKNPKHIKAICPRRWSSFLAYFNLSDKAKLWILIFTVIIIGGGTFAGAFWVIMRLKWWILFLIGGYFTLYEIVGLIAKVHPGKMMRSVMNIVSLPIVFLYLLTALVQPFITVVGTYFFVVSFAFGIPALIMICLSKLVWLQLRPETAVFVVLALGSILSSNYFVSKSIIRHTPLKDWGNHTYESYREKLAFYLVHPSNMVFLIYLIYFVFLSVSGYLLIQNGAYMISESFDVAILKAFLVYIAYTNMRTKAKNTEIEAKELLGRISSLFVHDKYE